MVWEGELDRERENLPELSYPLLSTAMKRLRGAKAFRLPGLSRREPRASV